MHIVSRFLAIALVVASVLPAVAQRKLGEFGVEVENATIPVRVSATTPELQTLAQTAFNAHGLYRLVASGQAYDIRFSAVAPTQVRVDVTRGSAATPVAAAVASGMNARQALLRAADVAVEKTNGRGLRGFFTAQLAFISQRAGRGEIYASELFPTGQVRQLTFDKAHILSPRWSPDGARIIFTSFYKNGAPDIYVMDAASGRKETFMSVRGTNTGARFSPNGQQVAMVLSGEGRPEIYISTAQGRQPVRKTNSDSAKSSPAWSPDGSQLVFAMEPGPQLHIMSAAGGPARRLNVGSTYAAEPDWSQANPNKIACTVRVGGRFQIAVYDLAAGKGQVVSKADFDGVEPVWLGDGRHLVYTARDRRTSRLCILDTETGKSTGITALDSAALQASVWTPAP